MAGVVIALQAACDCGAVQEPTLQRLAAAADLRVRRVAAAAADLIVTRAGQTAAFLLWRGAAAEAAARTNRAASSFRNVFVLLPNELACAPAVLDAAARLVRWRRGPEQPPAPGSRCTPPRCLPVSLPGCL